MGTFEVPKKINRHLLKAINSLSQELNKRYIPEDEIIARVKYQIKNLIPVKGVEDEIKKALYNFCQIGVLRRRNGAFGIRRILDEMQPPKSTVVSKNIGNADDEEQPSCSNRIEQSTFNQHPSEITLATGSDTLIQTTQQPLVEESLFNLPSGNSKPLPGSVTIDGVNYKPPFKLDLKNAPFGLHLCLARSRPGTDRTIIARGRDKEGNPIKATVTVHRAYETLDNPENDSENDDCETSLSNQQNADENIDHKNDNESQNNSK